MKRIKRFLREEEGVSAVEYGLIAALIAVAIIAAISTVGTELDAVFTDVGDELSNATN